MIYNIFEQKGGLFNVQKNIKWSCRNDHGSRSCKFVIKHKKKKKLAEMKF